MPATPSFDNIAPVYDRLARGVFGKAIVRAQTHFLDRVPDNAQVLIVGGGTGWILTELLQRSTAQHIDYVEASAQMLRLAQHRYQCFGSKPAGDTQVRFIQGTEQNLPPENYYDVVITFFVLDMYQGKALKHMMQKLYALLKPDGYWLFSDFQISNNRRWWHQPLVSTMFLFFRLTCHLQNRRLPDYDQVFRQLGLIKEEEKAFFGKLIISAVYSTH